MSNIIILAVYGSLNFNWNHYQGYDQRYIWEWTLHLVMLIVLSRTLACLQLLCSQMIRSQFNVIQTSIQCDPDIYIT